MRSRLLIKSAGAACAVGLALTGIATGSQAMTRRSAVPAPGSLGTFVDAVAAPSVTLDPMFSNSASVREIDSAVFDELVQYNQSYRIVPDLAASWKTTGHGLHWTFDLVPGHTFSNGQVVTSRDVIASLKRFMAVGVGGSTLKGAVRSMSAPSKYVVDITLTTPNTDFLALLANPLTFVAIMPAKYAASRKELAPPDLIGTGPYQIKSWISDQYTLLQRNRHYTPLTDVNAGGYAGKKVAYFRQLKYQVVPDAQTRLLGLESGQFQYAEELPFSAYQTLKSSPSLMPEANKNFEIVVWYINNYEYPTNNIWFRRAMAQALNDTSIMRILTQGNPAFYALNPSGLFMPTQKQFYDGSFSKGVYNVHNADAVKADLQKAHYNGQPLVILTNQQYSFMYQMTVAAVAQFKAMGINAQLDNMTWTSQLTYLTKQSGFGLFTSGNSLRFDPVDLVQNIGQGGALDWGFSNKTINTLFNAYTHAATPTAQTLIAKRLQAAYWQSVPALTVGNLGELDGMSKSMHGYQVWYLPRFWNVYS